MNYKINLKQWAIIGCLLLTSQGCKKEVSSPQSNEYQLRVQLPLSGDVETRTASDELAILSASVLFYDASAVESDLPKATIDIASENIQFEGGSTVLLNMLHDKSIAAGDITYVVFNKKIDNLANVARGSLIDALSLNSSSGLVDLATGLPMYGYGAWVTEGTTIKVKRAVAKVQLRLQYGSDGHVAGDMGSTYTVANTTFKLYQLSDVGNIDGSPVGSTGSTPVYDITNVADIKHPSVEKGESYVGANYIFAYPYSTKSIGNPGNTFGNKDFKPERIAMIMKNDLGGGKFCYHRLDMYDHFEGKYLDILNNFHYTVNLREVSVGGYSTAKEALNSPPSNVQYEVIVEEEGNVVVGNGQYILNIDEKGRSFEVTEATATIELAKFSRIMSTAATIVEASSFSVVLEESLRIGGVKVAVKDVPAKLDEKVKSVSLTVSGDGFLAFRYIATLGNIVLRSELITVNSNFKADTIHSSGKTLPISIFDKSVNWSVVPDKDWVTTETTDPVVLNVVIAINDLTIDRTAKLTITDNNDVNFVLDILQTKPGPPIWADRNIGVDFSDVESDPVKLEAALKDPLRSRYHFYEKQAAVTGCDRWIHDGYDTWRLPTQEDMELLISYPNITVNKDYMTVPTHEGNVYFPLSGYRDPGDIYRADSSNYWTSTSVVGTPFFYLLHWSPELEPLVSHGSTTNQFTVRCVR